MQIENAVANGHADVRLTMATKDTKGQILQREISGWIIGFSDPTA